jgi:hypothetical protein
LQKENPDCLQEQPEKPSDAQGPPVISKGASLMVEIKSPREPQGI